jgi:recombination associated protein RdgC
MFFKNLIVYRLTQVLPFDVEALQAALATKPTREPATQEFNTYGFVAPFGKGEDAPLVHASSGYLLVAAKKIERVLPGSAVNDEVKKRVEAIEAEQLRKVYKKERDQIKDEVIQTFLPRTFLRHKTTYAAIDVERQLVLVNSASDKAAEDLLSTLREVLGSLPVRPITVKVAPAASMTDWLKTEEAPENFFVLDSCLLRDTHEDGGKVRCDRQDLTSDEVKLHLATGKFCTTLSLAYKAALSFVLGDDLSITRLKFEDLLVDQAAQDGGEDALGQLDASFVLMMLTFREFLPDLFEALGGEEVPQAI